MLWALLFSIALRDIKEYLVHVLRRELISRQETAWCPRSGPATLTGSLCIKLGHKLLRSTDVPKGRVQNLVVVLSSMLVFLKLLCGNGECRRLDADRMLECWCLYIEVNMYCSFNKQMETRHTRDQCQQLPYPSVLHPLPTHRSIPMCMVRLLCLPALLLLDAVKDVNNYIRRQVGCPTLRNALLCLLFVVLRAQKLTRGVQRRTT